MQAQPEFSVLSVALRARLELPGGPWAGPEACFLICSVGGVGTRQVLARG